MDETEKSQNVPQIIENNPIPVRMPSAPDFLLKKQKDVIESLNGYLGNPVAHWSVGKMDIIEAPVQEKMPEGILHEPGEEIVLSSLEYRQALNDRRQAEINNAEIYGQYLDVVALNEKLLRARGTLDRFKLRVRRLYDQSLKGDQNLANRFQVTQVHLAAAERALGDIQIENETLRISLETYDEAHKSALEKLRQSENASASASENFQNLMDEFENRGILLEESDRKIRSYLSEMDQLNQSLKEGHEKLSQVRDDNLFLQNQMRELQLREAGVSALNSELADATNRAQRQIHELEDRLQLERKQSQGRIALLEQEMTRLRENLRAEALLDQARQFRQSPEPEQPLTVTRVATTAPPPAPESNKQTAPQNQWNDLYNRWSHVIDGLSSHSNPIESKKSAPKKSPPKEQLLSEGGDLEEF